MSNYEKAVLQVLIWLCVYPAVLAVSYTLDALDVDWPKWVKIMLSTALTVPLIGLIASPNVEKLIAAARGESRADLKADEARAADGEVNRAGG